MAEPFDDVRRLREAYEAALDGADEQRAKYHEAIRKLYLSGLSLSQIAENLGISRQRVHEIVGKDASVKRRNRRRAIGSAGIIIAVGVAVAGVWLGTTRSTAAPSAFAARTPCKQPCGWPRFAAVYEKSDGLILAIVGHKDSPGHPERGGSAGPVKVAPRIPESRFVSLVLNHELFPNAMRSDLRPPPNVGFADVTDDPHLRSAVRGSLTDFRISNGRLVATGSRLATLLAITAIAAAGIAALAIFNVRASRRTVTAVPANL